MHGTSQVEVGEVDFMRSMLYKEVYQYVGVNGCIFNSTTGEKIQVKQGLLKMKLDATFAANNYKEKAV